MATRRTRTVRRKSSILLDRYKLGGILLTVGALFFFTFFMAPDSPISVGLAYLPLQAFGYRGSFVFFALLIITGLFILLRQRFYTKRLFKFSFLLLALICSILSFELLEILNSDITVIQNSINQQGGRVGYLGILGANYIFGGSVQAIKRFFIAALAGTIIAICIYYKIKIPAIKFESLKDTYQPAAKTKTAKKTTSRTSSSSTKSDNTEEPTSITSSILGAVGLGVSKKTQDHHENTEIEAETSTLKKLLKQKLSSSVQKKDDEAQVQQLHINFPADKPTYDLSLLEVNKNKDLQIDEERLLQKAQGIQKKLAEFNIHVDVEGFNIGPTVIQIKIKPSAGVKVSKIENLKKDLSLGLRTKSLRVLAPIPGGSNVGIEIPNPQPQMVRYHDILSSLPYNKAMQKNFTNLTIGKGISGEYIVEPLEAMPHLLVAGATGSGKSVGVNGFILSLMYQNSPAELKFIMVDPKQVELGIYEGIPYLLAPIITQPDKAVKVLKRAVEHMNQRYKTLKDNKVRNIDEYNEKMTADKDKMYRIVIIIDELADLMMSGNKKDTETYIARIAQMARAVGMHLILATQRPSVNVITGLIKANIPTRIAFSVVSQIDSRTIIDTKGAEDLVGKGDLLYSSPKAKYPIRVQSPFIDTGETDNIVNAIKAKYMADLTEEDIYHPEIMRILESKGEYAGAGGDVSANDEALLEQAIDLISQTQKCSATMLQRKLGVGFPRAARLVDILEERGMVGPQQGAKPREILI